MDDRLEALWEQVGSAARTAGGITADAAYAAGTCAAKAAGAVRRALRRVDTRAEIHLRMRELGELLYATHTGNPTDSGVLLEKMEQIDALKEALQDAARPEGVRRCAACGREAAEDARFCKHCGTKL